MFQEMSLIQIISLSFIPLIFAITLHEVAHGYVAWKLGDPTAKMLGRLTINPFAHIDILGTIIIPAFLLAFGGFFFGWAKPVPVNWRLLNNPKRDMALVALAGPMANFAMAIFWAIVIQLALTINTEPYSDFFGYMGLIGIFVNLLLGILNLLPIPPLDGSRLVSSALPNRYAYYYDKLEPYGFFILLLLIISGILPYILLPPFEVLFQFLSMLFQF